MLRDVAVSSLPLFQRSVLAAIKVPLAWPAGAPLKVAILQFRAVDGLFGLSSCKAGTARSIFHQL